MSSLVLVLGILLLLVARAGARRPRGNRPIWVVALGGSELAGPLLAVSVTLAAWTLRWDRAGGPVGRLAFAAFVAAAAGFALSVVRALLTRPVVESVVSSTVADAGRLRTSGAAGIVVPVSIRPRAVEVETVRYGPHDRHLMDRHRRADGVLRPVMVYVHGGGWWRGRRSTQARPMRHLLAASGWDVFAPSYRLSPEVAVPGHLVDVKRAIAWIRTHADDLGVDPGFIAVSGGSTGGNLAALVALTAGDRALQPGFEDADTSVQACVPLYGVHDMLRPSGEPLWPYLADSVMQTTPDEAPEAWRRASPIRSVRSDRPPFFVIHGAADTLVRPSLSRRLVEALRDEGGPPVTYLEVPWATHGFDFFAGPRGRMVAEAIRLVLDDLYARRRPGES